MKNLRVLVVFVLIMHTMVSCRESHREDKEIAGRLEALWNLSECHPDSAAIACHVFKARGCQVMVSDLYVRGRSGRQGRRFPQFEAHVSACRYATTQRANPCHPSCLLTTPDSRTASDAPCASVPPLPIYLGRGRVVEVHRANATASTKKLLVHTSAHN